MPCSFLACGSSPRVRGKRLSCSLLCSFSRIIPASAGQTCTSYDVNSLYPDHPRECGANGCGCVAGDFEHGSSPRVRGKPSGFSGSRNALRIIPASAGQTDCFLHCFVVNTDHPRECGANLSAVPCATAAAGSSPRVRGKRCAIPLDGRFARIIPASAGQTGVCLIFSTRRTDHPRECGANTSTLAALRLTRGSSPRVRGKQLGKL